MHNKIHIVFRIISGTAAAIILLPIYLIMHIVHTVSGSFDTFRRFYSELFQSLTGKDQLPPIGLKGFYEREECRIKAQAAEDDYDYDLAVCYWKKCAMYFDTDAMISVAEYYWHEAESATDDNIKAALEWYAVAASFKNDRAMHSYQHLSGHDLTNEELIKVKRSFIKSRHVICR